MKKILITGASGFFGRHVISRLIQENFHIIGTYHTASSEIVGRFREVEWEKVDLHNDDARRALLKKYKPHVLLHLAWSVPTGEFWYSLDNLKWLMTSASLFREFCEEGGNHFIGAGTLAEYDWNHEELIEDVTPLNPKTLYGQCKKSLYEILGKLQENYSSVTLTWLRIGYFFGEGEPKGKLISLLIEKVQRCELIKLVDGDTSRDYGHVKHFGELILHLIISPQNLVLNVSGGTLTKMRDLAEFIAQVLGKPLDVLYGAYQPATIEPLVLRPNLDKMMNMIGYCPNMLWDDLRFLIENDKVP